MQPTGSRRRPGSIVGKSWIDFSLRDAVCVPADENATHEQISTSWGMRPRALTDNDGDEA
jgi:hypothetical protein